MKTELQKTLAAIAPSIAIRTIWEHDPDHYDIREDCDGFDDENPEDWQSEVRATAICGGEEITGSAYLGGTWEKAGDNPAESNPDISGYELDMTREALRELRETAGGLSAPPSIFAEVSAALEYMKAESGRRYDEQRATLTR